MYPAATFRGSEEECGMARVIFMGSAEYSVPSLMALTMAHQVVGVVTQPDRPAGRGQKVVANPVKRLAEASEFPIYQPTTLRTAEAVSQLAGWEPEVIVVAAFGHILREPILELALHGCVNVHASLLPRWRGASPVAAAILAGDTETGVTIMKMDRGMDTGPILAQEATGIEVDDTTASLSARLAELGAWLLVEVLPPYLEGDLVPMPQPEAGVTYASLLTKEDGRIDWTIPAVQIDRQVRAFTPWPGAYTFWEGTLLKVLEAIPFEDWTGPERPGTILEGEVRPLVATGEGAVWLTRLQLAGKKAMTADVFLRGRPDFVGAVLGLG
jgi:methionyl-tRNA formyltransferase